MSVNNLLNQSVSLYSKASYGADGREVVGVATTVPARFVEGTKSRLLPNQQIVTIDALIYLKPDQSIEINDKVTYGSTNYKVHAIKVGRGLSGDAHHKTVEVKKWQV